MTYLLFQSRQGRSTIPVSARVQTRYIERAKKEGWKFNALVNSAVSTLIHEYQTDQLPERSRDDLKRKDPWSIPDGRFVEPTTAVSVRLRSDLYDYMAMNQMNRNCSINYGLERWLKYYDEGRVAGYVVSRIKKRQ